MKKNTLLSFMVVLVLSSAFAQKPATAIFAEIGGPGLASFNYDMRFKKENGGLGFRVGIGGFSDSDISMFTVPVGLNYLLSKDNKNYFEIGAGVTYVSAKDRYTDPFYYSEPGALEGTFGHLNFGYRMAPKNGGFFFRAAINPVFGQGEFIPYYGGIAFGYKF